MKVSRICNAFFCKIENEKKKCRQNESFTNFSMTFFQNEKKKKSLK